MDYINICKGGRHNQYCITSKIDFFKTDYIKVDISDNLLTFQIPTIDYNGKQYKPSLNNNKTWRCIEIISDKILPLERLEIDSEKTTEDKLVVYYG